MKREITSFVSRLLRDESGAVFILVAMGIVFFLGLGALVIDVSRIVYAQRTLQDTTDLAAQAGATVIYSSSVSATATATAYSAKSGSYNFQKGLNVTSVSATLKPVNGNQSGGCPTAVTQYYPGCTTNSPNGISAGGCANSSGCNAIVVTQQAKVSLTLGEMFGMGPVTLTASSLALAGINTPVNVMMVLDNTASMNDTDPSVPAPTCGGISNPSRVECALAGIQTLLTELSPTRDQVGLMVFPPVATSPSTNPARDATCNGSTISVQPYTNTTSATYLILAPNNNYKANNTSTSLEATTSSGTSLVNATCHSGSSTNQNGVTSTCGTCSGDQVVGGQGTYLAGAITAAQAELVSTNDTGVCANYLCQNVMIVLSDGGAGGGATLWQGSTTVATATNGTTLTFASGTVPADVIPGTSVNYECTIAGTRGCTSNIPAGTSVMSVDGTKSIVTLSGGVSGIVPTATSINFGGNNQCWESIRAAHDAAQAGTRVISIAYGSAGNYQNTTYLSPNSNGCSDTETPAVNSCYTMLQIASRPSAIPNLQDFYSDPMGGSCTSPDNPNYTSIAAIFENIGYSLRYTSAVACGTAQAGGSC
jgi:Putative Flp pilus-assembly TadE/G-like